MSNAKSLPGRVALVTGAGVRLGRAFALGLADAGADVLVHYHRSADEAEATAERARSYGIQAATVQADLSELDQVQGLLDRSASALDEVDLLVNSAAIFGDQDATSFDGSAWQRHIDINLRAPVFLTKALAHRRGEQPSAVVNLLDWRALRPGPDHVPYTIAKAGLAAATKSLAQAFAPNMRVNGLALGAILPPPDSDGEKDPALADRIPQDRWGRVDEAVEGLLFLLAGPSYITGEILHVDGGRHLT